jgi:spore maturation protein CgeB
MSDDQWRFKDLWEKCIWYFDCIATTCPISYQKYLNAGQKTSLCEYWVKEQNLTLPSKKYTYDVSFIGGKNSWRKFVINELESKGISVACFGDWWENGRVSFEEMYDIFNNSRINLNLSNSIHHNIRYLFSGIIHFSKRDSFSDIWRPLANILLSKKNAEQIKARFFEVMGAWGFLLSYDLEGIEKYFVPEKDIGIYSWGNISNLHQKIQYYLSHEEERQQIAMNWFELVKEHYTFEKILSNLISNSKW